MFDTPYLVRRRTASATVALYWDGYVDTSEEELEGHVEMWKEKRREELKQQCARGNIPSWTVAGWREAQDTRANLMARLNMSPYVVGVQEPRLQVTTRIRQDHMNGMYEQVREMFKQQIKPIGEGHDDLFADM